MNCDQSANVQRYYDGELSDADRRTLEAHLIICAACAAELADLRRLSSHLSGISTPTLSNESLARLHATANVAEERGVLRLAEWLTAAAAAVLAIGITGLMRGETIHAKAPDTWEQAAVAYPSEAVASERAELVQMAEWIRADLSGGSER
jgi:anti-sigma factor RsiW